MASDEQYAQDEIAREALAMVRNAVACWSHEGDESLRGEEQGGAWHRHRMRLALKALKAAISAETAALNEEDRLGRLAYESFRGQHNRGSGIAATRWADLHCSIQEGWVTTAAITLAWTQSNSSDSENPPERPPQPPSVPF